MNCFNTNCIYYTPSTAVDFKPKPCSMCARNYRDFYKSTSVPINKQYSKPETVILKNSRG